MDKKDRPNNQSGPKDESLDSLDKDLSTFRLIESVLREDDKVAGSELNFDLKLGDVLDLLPQKYVTGAVPESVRDMKIPITVDDLFRQLAAGKVSATVANLVFSIPADLISSEAFSDEHTVIALPLSKVVAAIDPALLKRRMATQLKSQKIADIPDPFGRIQAPPLPVAPQPAAPAAPEPAPPPVPKPEEKPAEPVAEVLPPPAPPPAAEVPPEVSGKVEPEVPPVAPPEEEVVEPVAEVAPPPVAETPLEVEKKAEAEAPPIAPPEEEVVEPVAEAVPPPVAEAPPEVPRRAKKKAPVAAETEEIGEEPEELERLGGINLNAATVAQLMTLDGVTPTIAQNIVEYRVYHGPFKSIFALAGVPRLGRKAFKKITGMAYSDKRAHRKLKLAKLLNLPVDRVGHLPAIVEALVAVSGVKGCLISDKDGLLLAQTGAKEYAESLSAVAPRIIQQARDNMKVLNIETIDSVSLAVGDNIFTLAASGTVFLTVIHKTADFTRTQLKLVHKTGVELAWLLSHRGYVGREADAAE